MHTAEMGFQKLVRFEEDGSSHYGNLINTSQGGYEVEKLTGNLEKGFQPTKQVVTVSKVCDQSNELADM